MIYMMYISKIKNIEIIKKVTFCHLENFSKLTKNRSGIATLKCQTVRIQTRPGVLIEKIIQACLTVNVCLCKIPKYHELAEINKVI